MSLTITFFTLQIAIYDPYRAASKASGLVYWIADFSPQEFTSSYFTDLFLGTLWYNIYIGYTVLYGEMALAFKKFWYKIVL